MDKGSIPLPKLEDVLVGSRERKRSGEGYNPVFYYPRQSLQKFIDRYSRGLQGKIKFRERVLRIDAQQKRVTTTGGTYPYDHLINTMPLKELLGIIVPAPPFPRQQLQNISTLVANVVLAYRRRRFHWLYLPENRFSFYRVGYYPGSGAISVYLEKTVASTAPIDGRRLFGDIESTLRQIGMIDSRKEITFFDLKKIPVSYVIFDNNWPRLVPVILSYLRQRGIYSIGRYGSWNYSSMADDIKMALETARAVNRK
jgi:protoporphyrinogen oxidase